MSPAIAAFRTRATIFRQEAPTIVDGLVTSQGVKREFDDNDGALQPMTQKEVLRLPEGMRNQGRAKYFSPCRLLTVDLSDCGVPDVLKIDSVEYQVDKADPWDDLGGYFRYELIRVTR